MFVTTSKSNSYSYLCHTNEIVNGIVEEQDCEWRFAPLIPFSTMNEVEVVVIGVTEQCNLRCSYCCYSGAYENNRSHGLRNIKRIDIDEIYDFVLHTFKKRPLQIAFYGGEPLLQYALLQYAVEIGRERFDGNVDFSISTNATLLTKDKVDWLLNHGVKILISIDGTKTFHDLHRIYPNGKGSFDKIRDALSYIVLKYPQHQHLVSLQMTMPSFRDIEQIASEWNNDILLRDWEPSYIHGLAVNFSLGVNKVVYEEICEFYKHLLNIYEEHPDWVLLKAFFNMCIADWKDRPIMEIDSVATLSTCMPSNPRLFVDTNMQIAICEKISDIYRIGTIKGGIDWNKANEHVQNYYSKRVQRCSHCPFIRMCTLCLTSIEYTEEQMDVLCHNERIYTKINFWLFCEMAERRMIE